MKQYWRAGKTYIIVGLIGFAIILLWLAEKLSGETQLYGYVPRGTPVHEDDEPNF